MRVRIRAYAAVLPDLVLVDTGLWLVGMSDTALNVVAAAADHDPDFVVAAATASVLLRVKSTFRRYFCC